MWSKYLLHHLLAWFLGWVWVAAQTCWFMASDLLSLTDRLKVQHHLSALMAALDVMFYSLNTGQYFSQRPLFVAVLINTLTSVTSKHSRASLCGFCLCMNNESVLRHRLQTGAWWEKWENLCMREKPTCRKSVSTHQEVFISQNSLLLSCWAGECENRQLQEESQCLSVWVWECQWFMCLCVPFVLLMLVGVGTALSKQLEAKKQFSDEHQLFVLLIHLF